MSLILASILAAAAANATPPAVFTLGGETEALVLERKLEDPNATGADSGDAPPAVAPAVKAGTPYRTVTLKGVGDVFKTSGAGKVGASGCGEAERAMVPFKSLPDGGAPYLLIPGDWAAVPKTVDIADGTGAANEALIAKTMAENGIKDAKILRGTKIVADIDGDGKPDTLLNVTNEADGAAQKSGDYTALIAIMSNNGKETTVPLIIQLADPANPEAGEGPLILLNLVAVADIDGDGKMEVVTLGFGEEEHYVDVWSIGTDGTVTITYQAYCGV